MKTYKQFKQIAYKNAVPHKVFNVGTPKNIKSGKAMSKRSSSSAGGGSDGSGGDGGE